MSNLVTLWFDKDGVLAQYDYSLYEPEYGAPAPWKVHNAHVFRHLPPYASMCQAFHKLYLETTDKKPSERLCNMHVLTAVADGVTLAEHVIDGMFWCKANLELRERDFYACAVAKENVPIDLRSEITKYDILLDDYMPNLLHWQQSGGTAVKVCNGINSVTQAITCIRTGWTTGEIYNSLCKIITLVKEGTTLPNGLLQTNDVMEVV